MSPQHPQNIHIQFIGGDHEDDDDEGHYEYEEHDEHEGHDDDEHSHEEDDDAGEHEDYSQVPPVFTLTKSTTARRGNVNIVECL